MVRLPGTTVCERCREASRAGPKWLPADKGAVAQATILYILVASAGSSAITRDSEDVPKGL